VKKKAPIQARVKAAYKGAPPLTEKGQISTERMVLEDSHDPVLKEFSTISKLEKIATYVPTLRSGTTKPININANPLLSTGRASYEGLIQLMPRKGGVRDCCVAREGTVWSSVDFSAVELSTLAQVCLWTVGQSELASAINDKLDPHCILGSDLINMDYHEFFSRKSEKGIKDIRQAGKAGNFGFPGLMGEPRFVEAKRREGFSVCEWFFADGQCGAELTAGWKGRALDYPMCTRCLDQAKTLRQAYLRRWREMPLYWQWVQAELSANNDTIRQFVSGRIRGGLSGPQAANTFFQGLAADGAKRALIALTKEMYLDRSSPLFESRVVVFAHDEIILEIPEEKADAAARRQAEVMVQEMANLCPDVRISAEPALMRRWYKDAEPVFDSGGKLIPWEPKEKE